MQLANLTLLALQHKLLKDLVLEVLAHYLEEPVV